VIHLMTLGDRVGGEDEESVDMAETSGFLFQLTGLKAGAFSCRTRQRRKGASRLRAWCRGAAGVDPSNRG
jgi:hypothetical protein